MDCTENGELTISPEPQSKIELNDDGISHLREARRWTSFLSVFGFVTIGIIALAVVFTGLTAVTTNKSIVAVSLIPLILIGVLYYFPIYYLWKFTKLSKETIDNNDSDSLTDALKYLKRHYKFMAVMAIIGICCYAVAIIGMLVSGRLSNHF